MNLNLIKKKLLNLKPYGAVGIKQSLEDEGASYKEIKVMRKITRQIGLKLNIKIGGCEAKNDIYFCKDINPDSMVAPMVESPYALKKFLETSKIGKKIPLLINIETINAIKNLNKMIKNKNFYNLQGIVLGRSDLAGSLGLKKKDVNSKKIYNLVLKTFKNIKRKNKKFIIKMGGSITKNSLNFIEKLYKQDLLDRVETRNVEIKINKNFFKKFNNLIDKIFEFEIIWLKEKIKIKKAFRKNTIKFYQDSLRIKELESRK